jgi:hypothetical protein
MTTDAPAWAPLFSATTPFEELDAILQRQTDLTLAEVQLTGAHWTPPLRAAALAHARSIIERNVREVFETGWMRLQIEAGRLPSA